MHKPSLTRVEMDGLQLIVDPDAGSIGLVVAFTDRLGGVSPAPYESLNLGRATGDDLDNVDSNRARVAGALGIDSGAIHFVKQVHGTTVVARQGAPEKTLEEADGILLTDGGAAAVLSADCVPIVVSGREGVVALHAGWRGVAAGAIAVAVPKVGPDAVAWVGPSIHACCYEVGPEVVEAFERAGLPVADPNHVDPGRAAVAALHQSGVERVASWHECTSCEERFFSHRRDGITGRQAGIVATIQRV
ncbi:MAG: polyphenol oxidase family protein [Actinomycetota bacterium]